MRRDDRFGGSSHMVERISKRPAPSLRSAGVVTERCKLKVEKKAKKASSSLVSDSVMPQDGVQVESLLNGRVNGHALNASAYIICPRSTLRRTEHAVDTFFAMDTTLYHCDASV